VKKQTEPQGKQRERERETRLPIVNQPYARKPLGGTKKEKEEKGKKGDEETPRASIISNLLVARLFRSSDLVHRDNGTARVRGSSPYNARTGIGIVAPARPTFPVTG